MTTVKLIKTQKRKNPPVIEYAPPNAFQTRVKPPGQPSEELSIKIKLLQEQKELNDRILDLLAPTAEEVATLRARLAKIKLELQAINLELQMQKIKDQQDKLINK